MTKFKNSQILMLTFLVLLLFLTPLISSSSRPKYLYFIINLLILSLGADAGLIPTFSKPLKDKKVDNPATTIAIAQGTSSLEAKIILCSQSEKKGNMVENSVSEKIVNTSVKVNRVKKCPSMPSLFFIGGEETELELDKNVVEKKEEGEVGVLDEGGALSGQELFTKAETFIGNFYNQLKMQREDSWKRIHTKASN